MSTNESRSRDASKDFDVFQEILFPSFKFGAISGGCGFFLGSFIGILRSTHPVIFAVASGFQWSAVGATYWGARNLGLHLLGTDDRQQTSATVSASAIAGGTAGAIARGRRNILPGMIVFAMMGFIGQKMFTNFRESEIKARNSSSPQLDLNNYKMPFPDELASRKWFPFRSMNDKEYKQLLEERLLRIDAEILLLEEDIHKLERRNSFHTI